MPASTETRAFTVGGMHGLAVGRLLRVEPLAARHRDHPGLDALLGEDLAGLDGELDLGAGADEHHVGRCRPRRRAARSRRVATSAVSAKPSSPRGKVGTFCRVRIDARPAGRCCSRIAFQQAAVSLASRGADDVEAGDRPQRGEVLDRLVGRAVLAETDGVVRPHVGDRQLHQRGEPHRGAHVVGEGEERAAEDAGAAVDGDAVHDRAHAVLADAEVQHPAGVRVALPHRWWSGSAGMKEAAPSMVVLLDSARSAEPPQSSGSVGGDRVDHRAGGLAGGDALLVGREGRQVVVPAVGQGAASASGRSSAGVGGGACGPGGELLVPGGLAASRARARRSPRVCSMTSARHLEGLLGVEAEDLLGGGDLVVARGPSRAPCRCSARWARARR